MQSMLLLSRSNQRLEGRSSRTPKRWTRLPPWAGLVIIGFSAASAAPGQTLTRERAARAAIHPVADAATLRSWLRRVPVTRAFPPDFEDTLKSEAPLFLIEMTTAPQCLPCADLWARFRALHDRYGWQVRTISGNEALLRSGRLGLPWVGHPVAWVRPIDDHNRVVPIAIGTDVPANLARNLYLAAKMLTGVRPAVAVRAMSKFTGIVAALPRLKAER